MARKLSMILFLCFVVSVVSVKGIGTGDGDPLKVFPNPADEQLTVRLQSENNMDPVVHLIDLTGKVVRKFERQFSFEQESYVAELDISDVKSGVYFIKVIQGEDVQSRKLMIR